MRRILNNIISVAYTFFRIIILKIFHGKNFKSGLIERFSPNVILEFNRGCKVSLGQRIRIHSGTKVKVRNEAQLVIGDGTKFNYNCIVVCHKSIIIGEGTEFGPSVYIYDHDHDFRTEGGLKSGKFRYSPVSIGKNCWIGANTIILRGSVIGDNCVIGAGCVVSGEIPSNSILVQKRNTDIRKIKEIK